MKITPLAIAVVLGLTASTTMAQLLDTKNWYVAPTVTATINDSSRAKDFGAGAGLTVGKLLNSKWNVEFTGQYLQLDGSHDEQANVSADALYFFNRNPDFAPYVSVGLGYAKEGKGNNNAMAKAGVGFTKKLTNSMDFRSDARYQWHSNKAGSDNLGDLAISVGVNIYLDK